MDWSLPSNSGRMSATWTVRDDMADHFVCDFRYRSISLSGDAPGVEVCFDHLVLSKAALANFVASANSWLSQPLNELASDQLSIDVAMGGGADTYVRLHLGDQPDLLTDKNSAATFVYCVANVSGDFAYVIDQSCLRTLIDGIRDALR